MKSEQNSTESLELWNLEAATFDKEPDHGLFDPVTREAWRELLQQWLPTTSSLVLDVGCGTGSLSVLVAEAGHKVVGIDFSPNMIELAVTKAKQIAQEIAFQVMDAAHPQFPVQSFDVVMCRHVLWTLPEPEKVPQRWMELLRSGGRLILIEGYWMTGAGLRASQITQMLSTSLSNLTLHKLSDQTVLWGNNINDERYAIVASR